MVKKIEAQDATIKRESADEASGHPLDGLADEAARIAEPGAGLTDLDVSERAHQEAQQEAAGQAAKAMMAGAQVLILGLLRAMRARIARKLPEIEAEWTDEVLTGPAAAAIPVLNKYAAKWMPMLGAYPEELALAMSCLPLCMGLVMAVDKHQAAARAPAPNRAAGDGG